MTRPTHYAENPKRAAIEQWTADPCGLAEGQPGTRSYFEDLLAQRSAYAPWLSEELDYASTDGLSVLDVGCGQGIDLARYAMAGARVTGVDLTPRHVELAQLHLAALGLSAVVVEGDAEALPFEDGSFERASSNGVLHHTPDIRAALHEMCRVLRPGGEARVIVYNRASFHYWLMQVLQRGVAGRELLREGSMAGVLASGVEFSSIGARPLVKVYSRRQIAKLMRSAGFDEVTTGVRHFDVTDTAITRFLASRTKKMNDPRLLDRLGRIGGWYVIAKGSRPAGQTLPTGSARGST